jgi:pyruvate dehydrogenase E2 component (dihydrolipoamide acetyltransferase)
MANVELPQLGESVEEGVITSWLVDVGDSVEVDQPIVEISTDKVDTEIPSPVAGTVQELRAEVDDTVAVGQVIAVIGEGAAPAGDDTGAEPEAEAEPEPEAEQDGGDQPDQAAEPAPQPADDGQEAPAAAPAASTSGTPGGTAGGALTSPLVRRLLREAGLDTADVQATGPGGRITREDAERAIAAGGEAEPTPAAPAAQEVPASAGGPVAPPPAVPAVPAATGAERPEASPTQIDFDGQRQVTQDLSRVRKAIAKGMWESLQSTAQLTAAVEVDMTAIMHLRAATKDQFKATHGASLSPLPFISRAVTMTIPRHPAVNASMDLDGGTATYHRFINLGMAVDTERGLLVPNIKNAEDLTVAGLAKAIGDIARRTRDKKIQPDEITGATFTITNTGSRGTLFDTPILNPPEVGILAACAIEKRPVVVSDGYGDSIAIRWMSYLCLSYDHRMLDGADAARFLQDLKWVLEHHDFSGELGV